MQEPLKWRNSVDKNSETGHKKLVVLEVEPLKALQLPKLRRDGTTDLVVIETELQKALPGARVLKAFNTNFAATLAAGTVGTEKTTVLVAGDDADAKAALINAVTAGGLAALDAGALARAHELEAIGFLQLTLAASEKTSWTAGFAVVR